MGSIRPLSDVLRNPWGEATGLFAAAPVLFERGEISSAVSYLQQALSLSKEGGIAVATIIRPILAWIYGELGDSSRGLETIADDLGGLQATEPHIGDGMLRELLLGVTAYLHMLNSDRTQAEAYLAEAEKLDAETVMDFLGISVVVTTLLKGGIRLERGDFAGVLAIADDDLSRKSTDAPY